MIKISFFENIIYWFWIYSLKIKVMYPWSFARAITTMLKFSNTALIAFIIIKIMNIENKDTAGFVIYTLFVIIFTADMIIYDRNKYCVLKTKYYQVFDEKFCVLKVKYDSLSRNAIKRHKTCFYLYLIITGITNAVFGIYLYNNLE
jgi:hypothetical protein